MLAITKIHLNYFTGKQFCPLCLHDPDYKITFFSDTGKHFVLFLKIM